MRRFKLKGRVFDITVILFIAGILVWSFLEYTYALNRNVETTVNSILLEHAEPSDDSEMNRINNAYADLAAAAEGLSGQELNTDTLAALADSAAFAEPVEELDIIRADGYSVQGHRGYAGDSFFKEALRGEPTITTLKADGEKLTSIAIPIRSGDTVTGVLRGFYRFEQINAFIDEKYGSISRATLILIVKLILVFLLLAEYILSILRKKATVLEQQKKELDTLTANIPGGVLCCENDQFLTIRYLSDGFLHMTGFTRDDITLNFSDQYIRMIYPKDRDKVLRALSAPGAQTYELRYRIVRKDGTVRWLLDKGQLVTECGDSRLYSVLIDVSDQKKAETELNQNRRALEISNEKYQIIINQLGCIIFEYDHAYGTVSFNRMFKHTFGYTPPKMDFPDSFFEEQLIHPEDWERFEKFSDSMFKGAPSCKDVFRLASGDGIYIPCLLAATTIYDETQTPIKTVGRLSIMEKAGASVLPQSG